MSVELLNHLNIVLTKAEKHILIHVATFGLFYTHITILMEQHAFKNANNCLNTNIYSYLVISGCQSSDLYLIFVLFSTPVLIRHLCQLKTVVFLHWYLIHAVPLTALAEAEARLRQG
jgi:hypothetical protein